jgi:hypothetical protein
MAIGDVSAVYESEIMGLDRKDGQIGTEWYIAASRSKRPREEK